MKKRLLKYLGVLIITLILSEICLRIFLDNAHRVIYIEDPFCEYLLVPGQDVTRFHNHYKTNEYGMRSPAVSPSDKKRILLFGDSVLNGGTKISQDDLLNYALEAKLEEMYKVEIGAHNASAGSWGPENAFRFLENYVDFEFDLIVLLFSSDDYHDNMHFRKVVGVEPAWPNDQPWLALTDLYTGFLAPKIKSWFGNSYDYLEGFDDSQVNPGWDLFVKYGAEHNTPVVFYHHPNTTELNDRRYSDEGILLNRKMTEAGVLVVNGLEVESEENYLDNIHINSYGHALIADKLFDVLSKSNLLNIEP